MGRVVDGLAAADWGHDDVVGAPAERPVAHGLDFFEMEFLRYVETSEKAGVELSDCLAAAQRSAVGREKYAILRHHGGEACSIFCFYGGGPIDGELLNVFLHGGWEQVLPISIQPHQKRLAPS